MKLTIKQLEIPFKQAFAHATATRSCTESVLVAAETFEGSVGVGEGCPRKYVTGETIHTAINFFDAHRGEWEGLRSLEDLKAWVSLNKESIDRNPACWCALELALLDGWGKDRSQSIEGLLELQELTGIFLYSAVLGTEKIETFEKQANQFSALKFFDFKVKVNGNLEEDQHKIRFLTKLPIKNLRIRLDANNLWSSTSEAIKYLTALEYPFFAIEEPLQVGDYEGCRQVRQQLGFPIILDESFLQIEQLKHIQADPQTWIINIRISKMGGILRSLGMAKEAKAKGIPIIIGAQVGETSILTRAALAVANQYRDNLLAQEGAFGTYLLEHDIADAPLMFGKGGILDPQPLSSQPGLGLTLAQLP